MLYARTLSRLARQLFSDVIGIGYIEYEIRDSRGDETHLQAFYEDMPIECGPTAIDRALELLHDDHPEAMANGINFIETIAKHYGWNNDYTATMLLDNPEKTKIRYQEWRTKNEKSDISGTVAVCM